MQFKKFALRGMIILAVVLALCVLFGLGYFFGTVENKREFMKNTANKLIPDKEIKVIDFKTELKREQEQAEPVEAEAKSKE